MPSSDAALSVEDLGHSFGSRKVLDGLTFSVGDGEIFGLLGPNGSGKSTTLAILSGLLPRQTGQVSFRGRRLTRHDRAYRSELGVVFQHPSLDQTLTARENLELAAGLQGLGRSLARSRAEESLAQIGLSDRADDAVGDFSGGMKRRLDLARALIHKPQLLLLDEPTAGLDEGAFRATWETLKAMRERDRVTVLLSTHRPEEAERCDRLAVLAGGSAQVIDTPEALKSRVRDDLVVLHGRDPHDLLEVVLDRFEVTGRVDDGSVVVECERGHELIPRIVEVFPNGRLQSISLRRPTLGDVFLKITGEILAGERAESGR
jgi:ABC-2 type transport system ATP-binding protein